MKEKKNPYKITIVGIHEICKQYTLEPQSRASALVRRGSGDRCFFTCANIPGIPLVRPYYISTSIMGSVQQVFGRMQTPATGAAAVCMCGAFTTTRPSLIKSTLPPQSMRAKMLPATL